MPQMPGNDVKTIIMTVARMPPVRGALGWIKMIMILVLCTVAPGTSIRGTVALRDAPRTLPASLSQTPVFGWSWLRRALSSIALPFLPYSLFAPRAQISSDKLLFHSCRQPKIAPWPVLGVFLESLEEGGLADATKVILGL